jgi:hypothetical protein
MKWDDITGENGKWAIVVIEEAELITASQGTCFLPQ